MKKEVKLKLYAAYGEHINMDYATSVCIEAYPLAWGVIQDYELEFRSLANIKKSKGSSVPVVVWSISDDDEVQLDSSFEFELYQKETMKVTVEDLNYDVSPYLMKDVSEGLEALVYVMKDKGLQPVNGPESDYYNNILKGYQDNDIKPEPLAKAHILAKDNIKSHH